MKKDEKMIQGQFQVKVKTGFVSYQPVSIWKNGKPFYQHKRENGDKIKFNLPSGDYFTEGEIYKLSEPIRYDFKRSRKREKEHYSIPKELVVIFQNNPNKASVFLEDGVIILDNSFKNSDEVLLKYILYHEAAHYFYKSEHFCDEYAQERLLNEGYNKSQIIKASVNSLGMDNKRSDLCVNNIKKAKAK